MPYSFIDIEHRKSRLIKAVFLFLIVFYFAVAYLLWVVTKFFIFFNGGVSSLTGLLPFGEIPLVIGAAAVIASIHWTVSSRHMIETIIGVLEAQPPDEKDAYHQTFKNVVSEACVATGSRTTFSPYVIPSSGMNAFAASDGKGSAVIGVTEGLLATLNRQQLEAVVAHEAAHVVSGDSQTTTIICSLFGIYAALFQGLTRALEGSTRRQRGPGKAALYLLIILVILSVTQFIGNLLHMFLSRQKESRAAAVAVKLSRNPLALAEALYKISRGWRGVGQIPNSLGPLFIMSPEYSTLDESEGLVSDLFSTHPPTQKRVNLLLAMAHADASALKDALKPKERIDAEKGLINLKEVPKKSWLMYDNNAWQGPFDLETLLQKGVGPQSWISNIDENFIQRASEDKILHEAFAKESGEAFRIPGALSCPECRVPLSEALYEQAPILKCGHCGGAFVDKDVILRIMVRRDYAFSGEVASDSEAALKERSKDVFTRALKMVYALACPSCNNKMSRGFYSYGYPVTVDTCDACRKVWFQKNELEMVQYIYEKFSTPKT